MVLAERLQWCLVVSARACSRNSPQRPQRTCSERLLESQQVQAWCLAPWRQWWQETGPLNVVLPPMALRVPRGALDHGLAQSQPDALPVLRNCHPLSTVPLPLCRAVAVPGTRAGSPSHG